MSSRERHTTRAGNYRAIVSGPARPWLWSLSFRADGREVLLAAGREKSKSDAVWAVRQAATSEAASVGSISSWGIGDGDAVGDGVGEQGAG